MEDDNKGYWSSEAVHQRALARRRAAYRAAHPKEDSIDMPDDSAHLDADLYSDLISTTAAREPRLKIWQFHCNSGLRTNWANAGIIDFKDYFEEDDHLSPYFANLDGFKYLFYRVSVDGDFLRGYLVLGKKTTLNVVSHVCPHLDFWRAGKRCILDRWVADSKLTPCGRFYMHGHRPNKL